MYSLIIAGVCGVTTALTLYFTDAFGYGWSIFFGILGFGVVQMSIGFYLQRKVKAGMKAVEQTLLTGQKELQAKTQRWQLRPPGSIQAAQNVFQAVCAFARRRRRNILPSRPCAPGARFRGQ